MIEKKKTDNVPVIDPVWKSQRGLMKRLPSYNLENADKILVEATEVITSLNLTPVLIGGTCLGLLRDHAWLLTDTDIDILAYEQDRITTDVTKQRVLFAELLKREYIPHGFVDKNRNRWFWKYKLVLDLHISTTPKLFQHFQRLDKLVYKEKEYFTPFPVDRYLAQVYGADWNIPKRRPDILAVIAQAEKAAKKKTKEEEEKSE